MKKINLLNEETSNKIAAGEVVERPSSVVKELIENSIDAGAKVINIEIEDGGEKLIKITDDGEGIYPEDIETAFMPHATSKIKSIEDIYSISTLGFRGEALPSIASVSNTILRSRISSNEFGMEISINAGIKEYVKEVGTSIGTTIEVRDLFNNVPARKKFLKSVQREGSLISNIVTRIAIANSNISFRLINNGKKVLNTYSTDNFLDMLRNVYGKKTAENVKHFEKHTDIASVYGYVGNAEISRGSRNNQSVFVNKRYIKNKLIAAAVEAAVKSFMMINKYPFFVLFLDIFPEYVDVNVHPSKAEVKFENERGIFKIVFDAVHDAIKESIKSNFELEKEEFPPENKFEYKRDFEEKQKVQIPMDLKSDYTYENITSSNKNEFKPAESLMENNNTSFNSFKVPDKITKEKKINEDKVAKFPKLHIIGQFHNTYILAETENDFYMIDQHAAHEKILFEKYTKEIKNGSVTAQILITPEVMELSSEDFEYYIENREVFSKAGFNIEVFGDNTITIREVPNFLGKPQLQNLFNDILDNLKKLGSGETYEVKYMKIATSACKAAIKAHDALNISEMESLVNTLRYIDDPFNCPHGRPTIIKMSLYEVEKKFKRIQ